MPDINNIPFYYTDEAIILPPNLELLTPKQFGQLRDNMSRFKRSKGKRKRK